MQSRGRICLALSTNHFDMLGNLWNSSSTWLGQVIVQIVNLDSNAKTRPFRCFAVTFPPDEKQSYYIYRLAAFRRIPDSNIARHVSSEVHLFLIAAWDWLSVCLQTAWRDGYWWWGNLSPCKFSGKSEVRDPPLHRFTKLLVWGCKLFHPMWYYTFAVLAGSSFQDLPALNVGTLYYWTAKLRS